jgi:hypothetical protein
MVQDWEVKIKNLEVEHSIILDPKIKIALMTSFLPSDLEDLVFQWSDAKTLFGELRDKVMSLAVNRAAMAKPTAMEVDRVQADEYYEEYGWDYGEEDGWYEGEDVGISYVEEKCHRCRGTGHYARECSTPPPKGKGKGEVGKRRREGEGKRKGGAKGVGKGLDGQWQTIRRRVLEVRRARPSSTGLPVEQNGHGRQQCRGPGAPEDREPQGRHEGREGPEVPHERREGPGDPGHGTGPVCTVAEIRTSCPDVRFGTDQQGMSPAARHLFGNARNRA